MLLSASVPPAIVTHLPVCTFLIWLTPPLISLSIQLRDGWLSQSNWTVSTLLSVLTPPAMVRHLPVLRLISITGLLTGAARVTVAAAQNRPRMNTPDATRPAGARWKMVMMSLQCGPGGREQFSARCPAMAYCGFHGASCDVANKSPEVEGRAGYCWSSAAGFWPLSSRHWMI